MGEWQPIETAPKDGFFLVYRDGAMRTMWRYEGRWENPDIPVMVTEFGDKLVSNETERVYGRRLETSGGIYEPTHWQPLPEPPQC